MVRDETTQRFDQACKNGWGVDPQTGHVYGWVMDHRTGMAGGYDNAHLLPYHPRKGKATQEQILQRSGFREDWWVIRYAHAHVWTTLGMWALAHAEAATEALAEADAERAEWFAPANAKDAKRPEWVAA